MHIGSLYVPALCRGWVYARIRCRPARRVVGWWCHGAIVGNDSRSGARAPLRGLPQAIHAPRTSGERAVPRGVGRMVRNSVGGRSVWRGGPENCTALRASNRGVGSRRAQFGLHKEGVRARQRVDEVARRQLRLRPTNPLGRHTTGAPAHAWNRHALNAAALLRHRHCNANGPPRAAARSTRCGRRLPQGLDRVAVDPSTLRSENRLPKSG